MSMAMSRKRKEPHQTEEKEEDRTEGYQTVSAYHGWLISGTTAGYQQTRRCSRGETVSYREAQLLTTPPTHSPHFHSIPPPSPSVECPPNTKMSSQTSQSSSTTSASTHPYHLHLTSLYAHS